MLWVSFHLMQDAGPQLMSLAIWLGDSIKFVICLEEYENNFITVVNMFLTFCRACNDSMMWLGRLFDLPRRIQMNITDTN